MPDGNGTLTSAELKRKIARARKKRGRLTERAQHLLAQREKVKRWLSKAVPRLKRKRARERMGGPAKAVAWAIKQQGVAEKPDGSNWGVPVQDWIKYTGYSSPVPWCGCFVAYAACKIGGANIPARIRLGYHGYIIADARAKTNGLRAVSAADAKPGDIIAFDFAHIAMVRTPYDGSGYLNTVEGNTSPTSSGSQNNGGTVALKRRSLSDVAVIARPDY